MTENTTGRIFITGDMHGSYLPLFGLAEKEEIKKEDILIIAGDAGYVWNEDYVYKIETLHQIFPGMVAFIDGNHENHDLLDSMETSLWKGGRVHLIGDRVIHLMRGELYNIYDKRIFTFGGARSTDKDDRRTEGIDWWHREEPDEGELKYGYDRLSEELHDIDYVITHETPKFARQYISRYKHIDDDYDIPEAFDDWYQKILEGKSFKKWYFGHMHVDQSITPKLRALHNDILLLGEDKSIKWA